MQNLFRWKTLNLFILPETNIMKNENASITNTNANVYVVGIKANNIIKIMAHKYNF